MGADMFGFENRARACQIALSGLNFPYSESTAYSCTIVHPFRLALCGSTIEIRLKCVSL